MNPSPDPKRIDLEATQRLVEMFDRDYQQARASGGDAEHLARLRADIEQLRSALAEPTAHEDVHAGLHALRDTLHALRDELQRDAFRAGDYIARIGRLLGM